MIPFDVVLVPFPFADLSSTKRRPCLVVASYRPKAMRQHLVLCMMTSQVDKPRFPFDIEVKALTPAGLPKATLIRLAKIVTIDEEIVVKKLGNLAKVDRAAVAQGLKKLFADALP